MGSGQGYGLIEVDVLYSVQNLNTLLHRALEGLASRDEAHATRTLVDNCRAYRVLHIAGTFGLTARVDQSGAAHVAIEHLVTAEVDRMLGGQFGINALIQFAIRASASVERLVAPIVGGKFLLDDVSLDGDAQVIGLARKVGGNVVVNAVLLKRVVADVASENGGHTQGMRFFEGLCHFNDLASGLIGTEIDGGSYRNRAEVPRFTDRAEHDLISLIGIGQ